MEQTRMERSGRLAKQHIRVLNRRGQVVHEGFFFSLRGAIQDAVRQGKSLRGSDFRGMNLAHLDLSGGDFSRSDFREVDLYGANFEGAKFHRCNFKHVTLKHTAAFDEGALTGCINLHLVDIVDETGREVPGATLTVDGIQLPDAKAIEAARQTTPSLSKTARRRQRIARAQGEHVLAAL